MRKKRLDKKLKNKIIALMVVFAVAMSTGVWAAWTIYATTTLEGSVTSTLDQPIYFEQEFNPITLNTTEGAEYDEDTVTFTNDNSDLLLMPNITTTIDDKDDNCTDYIDDCNTTFYLSGSQINDNQVFGIVAGDHTATFNYSCDKLSCEQNSSTIVVLTEYTP